MEKVIVAETARAAGTYDKCIDSYKKAWEHAQKAIKKKKPKHEQLATVDERVPKVFPLSQFYPNSVANSTTIRYVLPGECHVALRIHNVAGERLVTLVDETQKPGHRSVKLDALDFAAGVYFCQLEAGDYRATSKMIVLR